MVVQTASEAIGNADAATTCDPGMCLRYTRTWLEIPSLEYNAISAWNNARRQHPGDRHPPRGAPLFWRSGPGGSGHGHIALCRGPNMRGTDMPRTGVVGNDDGSWPRVRWGMTYLGWSEDLNGILIPYLSQTDWRASGDVHVDKLVFHTTESQSVSRLRWRLTEHHRIPDAHKPGAGTSSMTGATYSKKVRDSVAYWQTEIAGHINGPKDGTSVSNPQANALFGPAYEVIEK